MSISFYMGNSESPYGSVSLKKYNFGYNLKTHSYTPIEKKEKEKNYTGKIAIVALLIGAAFGTYKFHNSISQCIDYIKNTNIHSIPKNKWQASQLIDTTKKYADKAFNAVCSIPSKIGNLFKKIRK